MRVAVALACLALAGCPRTLPPSEGCRAGESRCSPGGRVQSCSSTLRWENAAEGPCSVSGPGFVCCAGRDEGGTVLHACLPPAACVTEDGGAR